MRTPAILAAIVLITSAAMVPASEAVARDSNGRWRRLDVGSTKPES